MCSPAGWGHGAEDRVLSSFRAAALSAHLRPQPHSRPAAGTTNNLWWAVVDFLAELPQAGFPCSGEVLWVSKGELSDITTTPLFVSLTCQGAAQTTVGLGLGLG